MPKGILLFLDPLPIALSQSNTTDTQLAHLPTLADHKAPHHIPATLTSGRRHRIRSARL